MSANVSCPCAWTISKDVELAHFDIDEILHVKFNFFQNCFARQFYFCSLVQLCPTKLRIKERSIYWPCICTIMRKLLTFWSGM